MSNDDMISYISQHLRMSDLYAAEAIASVSAFIFQKRREMGLTQKEFAEKMGVSQGMVSRWESANYNFSLEGIAEIAEKLNTTFHIGFGSSSENVYLSSTRTIMQNASSWTGNFDTHLFADFAA